MVCLDGGFQAEESQELLLVGEFGRENLDEGAVAVELVSAGGDRCASGQPHATTGKALGSLSLMDT